MQRLEFDDELRNEPRWAAIGIDNEYVLRLRNANAGRLTAVELLELIGSEIDRSRRRGNLSAATESPEWHQIVRAICKAELEALARVYERDEGDYSGNPHGTNPRERQAVPG